MYALTETGGFAADGEVTAGLTHEGLWSHK
jgi:hypothetical protein